MIGILFASYSCHRRDCRDRDTRTGVASFMVMCNQPLFARLGAPIVLAHGLGGFLRIGVGRLTFTTYFRGIPEALEASGNRVLVTRVPPIAGVEKRARRLGEQI